MPSLTLLFKEGFPTEHKLAEPLIKLAITVPFADPQAPDVGVTTVLLAEQLAVDPPLEPVHNQYQGPEPVKLVDVPVEHKLVGVELRVCPLLAPHCPFTGVAAFCAEQLAVDPPFAP